MADDKLPPTSGSPAPTASRRSSAGARRPPRRLASSKAGAKAPGPGPGATAAVIVGIGTGAGGLEAFADLVGALPGRDGLGFVLLPHLETGEEAETLATLPDRLAGFPVRPARHGEPVEAGTVHLVPADRNATLQEGVLRLGPRVSFQGQEMPIDIFLRSLAADRLSRAVGVILSGRSTDGALGIEALKGEGGITFAQEAASARCPEMPAAAVSTGCVDYVLPPAGIARELARLGKHSYVHTGPEAEQPGPVSLVIAEGVAAAGEPSHTVGANVADAVASSASPAGKAVTVHPRDPALARILAQLRGAVGVDFSQYKPATIQRRIARRMALLRMERTDEYARFLQNNETETLALYQDILIKVTCFFRDPEAFQALKRKAFPRLFKDRPADEPVRFWVPGCATGEEAYSLAILLLEYLSKHRLAHPVQIFATDLSEPALERARAGAYIENIALDVSEERRRRFFTRTGRTYQVTKSLRDIVVFARQNLAKDPPFSRLDLISCRNLLIYLAPPLQQRAFSLFHYALRPGGFLLLGASESVGEFSDLFTPADRKAHLFLRKHNAARPHLNFNPALPAALPVRPDFRSPAAPSPEPPPGREEKSQPAAASAGADDPAAEVQREADRLLLNRFTPPGVLVSENLDVLQFRGQGHRYFEPAPGNFSFQVTRLVKEELVVPLRAAVAQAWRDGVSARRRAVLDEHDPARPPREVEIEATPLRGPVPGAPRHFLILFHELGAAPASVPGGGNAAPPAARAPDPEAGDRQLQRVKAQLANTRRQLQNLVEEQDASSEELKTANEELQSTNEELQSTNEELETAKEELQSTNEELATVNHELQSRNAELARLSNDLTNLLNSVSFAVLLLGPDLTIHRFTTSAARLFNLLPTDLGRPLSDLNVHLQLPDLAGTVAEVIETITAHESEVQDRDGHWYALSIRPYRTAENLIDGAVLALVNIDALKTSVAEASTSRDFSEAVVATVREPLLVLDGGLRVVSTNAAFLDTFHTSREETVGHFLHALGNGEWDIPKLTALLEDVMRRGSVFEDFLVEHDFRTLGRRRMLLNGRRIYGDQGRPPLILLAVEDTTSRRGAEAEVLAIAEREQRRMAHDLHDGLGQQLAGVGLMFKAFQGQLARTHASPEVLETAENILTQLNQATTLTRDLARGLHPTLLQADQFKTAMQTLATNVETLFKVVCTFRCEGACRPPGEDDEVATHLYRLAQEAVHNAVRHGKPRRIAIECRFDPGETGRGTLTVTDDGVGIRHPRPSTRTKTGMGLQIMRYRAEALNGRLTVERGPAGGTVVKLAFALGK